MSCAFNNLRIKIFKTKLKLNARSVLLMRHSYNGMLSDSLGEVIFSLLHFIAPSLNLMPCLSSWLEMIACLRYWGMREAIRAVISRREDKQGIQFKAGEINCCYENNEKFKEGSKVYKSCLKTYKSCLKLIFFF